MACPGSATDVIRGVRRRCCCALGMLAGSKQGLARGRPKVGRTSVGRGSDGISLGLLENMVRRMRGSVGGRRCARRGRVGGFWEWIWVLWECIWDCSGTRALGDDVGCSWSDGALCVMWAHL